MGMQPIDMQTLFSQLEKVSKMQVQQTQGMQLKNALQQEEISKQLSAKKASVEEPEKLQNGITRLKDQKQHSDSREKGERNKEQSENPLPEVEIIYFSDTELGKHVDISG